MINLAYAAATCTIRSAIASMSSRHDDLFRRRRSRRRDPRARGARTVTPADEGMLDELADAIVRRHLATPALFFLESMRPLSFVGSQMMLFLRPMINVVWTDPKRWDQLQRVLEERGSVEELARRLEAKM